MTVKEKLLFIIEHKRCVIMVDNILKDVPCEPMTDNACPVREYCKQKHSICSGDERRKAIYEFAIIKYIELFGEENYKQDLLEYLI